MQLSINLYLVTIVVAILSVISPGAAKCFSGGLKTSPSQKFFLGQEIRDICARYFVGNYNPGQEKRVCWMFAKGIQHHYVLVWVNNLPTNAFMSIDGCEDNFKKEIDCWYGGDRTFFGPGYNWRVIADPNEGRCPRLP